MNKIFASACGVIFAISTLAFPLRAQDPAPPARVDPELLKAHEFELELEKKLVADLIAILNDLKDDDESVKAAVAKVGEALKRDSEARGKQRRPRAAPPEIEAALAGKRGELDQQSEKIMNKLAESERYEAVFQAMAMRGGGAMTGPVGKPAAKEYKVEAVPADPNAKPLTLPADLLGHQDYIRTLAFSGDGQWLATIAGGKKEPNGHSIRVWDLRTGRTAYLLGLPQAPDFGEGHFVAFMALSHDGSFLLTSTGEGLVQIWDLKNRRPGMTLDLGGSAGYAPHIAISGDGKTGAAADMDEVVVFDLATGALIDSRSAAQAAFGVSLALSSDGKTLARSLPDETKPSLEVWRVGTKQVSRVGEPKQVYLGLRFSADNKRLFMLSAASAEAFSLEVETGKIAALFKLEAKFEDPLVVYRGGSLSFSADGKRLLSIEGLGETRLYDTDKGKKLQDFERKVGDPFFHVLALTDDGKVIARGGGKGLVRVMSADQGLAGKTPVEIGDHPPPNPAKKQLILRGHKDIVHSLDYTPDGKRLVSSSKDKTIRVWNTTTGANEKTIEISATCVRALRGGKTALVFVLGEESSDTKFAILNLETGKLSPGFGAERGESPLERELHALAQLPDGRFAGASRQGLSFWKANGTLEKTIPIDPPLYRASFNPNAFVVSPDGKRIFTDDVLLWDVPNGKSLLRTEGQFYLRHGGARTVAVSHNGKLVAGHQHTDPWKLNIWSAETGKLLLEKEFKGFPPELTTFSLNDKVLVMGSIGRHSFVDVATGEVLQEVENEEVMMESVFSPDGKQYANTSGKNIVLHDITGFSAPLQEALAANVSPSKSEVPPLAEEPKAQPFRLWTSSDGKFKLEAKLLGVKDGKVQLERRTGGLVEVPKAKLSAADVKYVDGKK